MRVTIYDVARDAGVSLATVSRVINHSPHVKESTRRRVQETIERLGFQPNLVASALMTKRTRLMALLIPSITNPACAQVAWGVEETAAEMDYNCIICNVGADPKRQAHYVNILIRKGIDGIIFSTPSYDDGLVLDLSRRSYPLTLMARDVPAAQVNRALTDDKAGGALAAQHLLELGHTSFLLVTSKEEVLQERARGFVETIRAQNLDVIPVEAKGSDITAGLDAGVRLLSLANRPTAVFATTDLLAIGIIAAVHCMGLDIPRDLSVVGYGGLIEPEAMQLPLTTIVQPMRDMGKAAAQLLFDTLQEGREPRQVVVEPKLYIGGTTGHPSR